MSEQKRDVRESPLVSVVIPVYFNEENIPVTWPALRHTLVRLPDGHRWEVVFVDDGSGDRSYEKLLEVRAEAPDQVRIVKFTRNFGQHAAIMAGLAEARGDACIVMSADLQDPPDLILEMVDRWSRGERKVVLATREARQDGFLLGWASRIFYVMMRRYAIPNMPEGGFDFFLVDRQVVEVMQRLRTNNGFLQGQVLWAGFEPALIYYTRMRRTLGRSRWTWSMKARYFFDGFVSYSVAPIRMITAVGLVVSLLSFAYAFVILVAKVFYEIPLPGWAPTMLSILVLAGVQLVMLGIIGEYLWRTFHVARNHPMHVIESRLGPESDEPAPIGKNE